MSNSSIEGRLKGLQERIEHDIRNLNPRDGGFQTPGGLGSSRPGSGRRPRPPLFSNREIPVFPPRSPHATETENRMREVYKVSGKLNVDGVEYRSHIGDLLHQGELGSGTCGHVVKMKHKPSGAVIAVKQMRRSGNSEETKRILMDLDVVVRSHDCPYIVRCLGCFVTDADVWICMELMASCFDKLLKRVGAPIPEAILGKVTVATVNALSYLKDSHGVIHRDVKPSNILLDERGNVKLCDFGISGRLVDSKAKTRSAGCAAYMAPERIDPPDPTRPDYDIRADVWSLGISLVELATGVFPYRDCQNDFEVLTRVIEEEPPRLPADCDFSPEFKSFVSQCLQKNYRQRPKYAKLLEHAFVVKSARSSVSVGDWYASLPGANAANATGQTMGVGLSATGQPMGIGLSATGQPMGIGLSATGQPMGIGLSATGQPMGIGLSATGQPISVMLSPTGQPISAALSTAHSMPPPIPLRSYESTAPSNPISVTTVATHTIPAASNGLETTPVNSYVTSAHFWTPEQITPTPQRARWATPSIFSHGGSTSQPTSLESDYSISPFPRRRTIDACASPPPPPVRRVSAENRWRASPASSGNTSPIVLQRFYHQTQQRRSRVDLHSTPRHRSLSREHSTGRSPEPPPRTSRQHHMLGHEANGSIELEPPPLHERLHPPSPLLLNNRLSEGRSQSLTRAELRNGYRSELAAAAAAAAAAAPQSKHNHDDQSWLHSLAGLVKRRLSQVKWHHVVGLHNNHPSQPHAHRHHVQSRWNSSESWSVPVSPLPPRAPPPRPAD